MYSDPEAVQVPFETHGVTSYFVGVRVRELWVLRQYNSPRDIVMSRTG
jgi:hypothetical protein